MDATPAQIRRLATREDVETIYYNYEIEPIGTVPGGAPDAPGPRAPEPGLVAINAPQAWAMGYDGSGVLVATLDTGVDGNHPALASRWRGADPQYAGHPEWAWFDPMTNTTFPQAFGSSHGTSTMGTVCGGAPGDQIGVAPGAQWIHAAVIGRGSVSQTVADALLAFEWLIDPDGNPTTFWDVPAVCSNSWRLTTDFGYPPCDPTFWSPLDACEAAGIVILFSAGNEGPAPETVGRPPDRATDDYRTVAVGAVDTTTVGWPVWVYSSRGPSHCTPNGSAAIKPDLTAPGVNVRSAVPGGGYDSGSGTSGASPHVNGTVALMRQACPGLTVKEIKQILYMTAHDLGPAGEDNDYGWGMIDAEQAVVMALSMCGPQAPHAFDGSAATDTNTPVTITLTAQDDGLPDPPGAMTYIIATLPAHGTLRDPAGGLIGTVPYTLLNFGTQVIYRPSNYYDGIDSFTFRANDGGVPPEGGDSNNATVSIIVGGPRKVLEFKLDSDPGWFVSGEWAFGHPTGQGGQSHGHPDPSNGATGANVYGVNLAGDYSTTPGGPYCVCTDALDLTGITQTSVKFQRWLNTDYQWYVYATIHVSNNGTTWTELWNNGWSEVADFCWSPREYSISAVADNQPAVYILWGYQIGSGAWAYSGWNIDDIEIWGLAPPPNAVGDLNCDGSVDFGDINPFVLTLADPALYNTTYPDCDINLADINGDGSVDFGDINPFVALLVGG